MAEEPSPPARTGEIERLLSALVLIATLGLFLAAPFVLAAGRAFFLPIACAFVLSLALSPLADALHRFGLPNALASLLSILALAAAIATAVFTIVHPAYQLAARLPQLLATIADHLHGLQGGMRRVSQAFDQLARLGGEKPRPQVVIAQPTVIEQAALATPTVLLEAVATSLLSFMLLESRVQIRRSLLLGRGGFGASLRAARAVRDVQDRVSAYLATVSVINAGVGVVVGLGAWAFGFPSPVMWGGLAALLNFLPYVGPLVTGGLIAAFGLGTVPTLGAGLAPAVCYLLFHLIEANVVTPRLLGRRFTINPAMILIAIAYFGWIWGVVGALLSVPLLLMVTALMERVGRMHPMGFLFGEPLFERAGEESEGA